MYTPLKCLLLLLTIRVNTKIKTNKEPKGHLKLQVVA